MRISTSTYVSLFCEVKVPKRNDTQWQPTHLASRSWFILPFSSKPQKTIGLLGQMTNSSTGAGNIQDKPRASFHA